MLGRVLVSVWHINRAHGAIWQNKGEEIPGEDVFDENLVESLICVKTSDVSGLHVHELS
jgi:hypothetical protein